MKKLVIVPEDQWKRVIKNSDAHVTGTRTVNIPLHEKKEHATTPTQKGQGNVSGPNESENTQKGRPPSPPPPLSLPEGEGDGSREGKRKWGEGEEGEGYIDRTPAEGVQQRVSVTTNDGWRPPGRPVKKKKNTPSQPKKTWINL